MSSDSSDSRDGAQHLEVAVIGGGQAGMAVGYLLKRQGRRFVILERAGEIAPAWRERWDSLTLFTSRRYSALPALPFPGDPPGVVFKLFGVSSKGLVVVDVTASDILPGP